MYSVSYVHDSNGCNLNFQILINIVESPIFQRSVIQSKRSVDFEVVGVDIGW